MKKIYFILFQEQINGVLKSQVFDTVKFLNRSGFDCCIVFFFNPRLYTKIRKELKNSGLNYKLIPSFKSSVKFAKLLIRLFIHPQANDILIGRGVHAAYIISIYKENKTIYDGRGAYFKELEEYGLKPNIEDSFILEKSAVEKTKSQIAVSNELVKYWKNNNWKFKYENVFVIPTLINKDRLNKKFISNNIDSKIRICFIGNNGKWQGEELLIKFIKDHLKERKDIFFNLLMKETEEIKKLKCLYPENIKINFVAAEQVREEIINDDYALLLRKNNVTNRVAAPTKFAEYLAAGLKIIISPNIGDYSSMVVENKLGIIFHENQILSLEKNPIEDKKEQIRFCEYHFTRESDLNFNKYTSLLK